MPEFQTSQQHQQELTWQLKDTAYRVYFLSLVKILQFYLGQAFLQAFAVREEKNQHISGTKVVILNTSCH